jgi:hypothetical protein
VAEDNDEMTPLFTIQGIVGWAGGCDTAITSLNVTEGTAVLTAGHAHDRVCTSYSAVAWQWVALENFHSNGSPVA